jgi:hypothetical protein
VHFDDLAFGFSGSLTEAQTRLLDKKSPLYLFLTAGGFIYSTFDPKNGEYNVVGVNALEAVSTHAIRRGS